VAAICPDRDKGPRLGSTRHRRICRPWIVASFAFILLLNMRPMVRRAIGVCCRRWYHPARTCERPDVIRALAILIFACVTTHPTDLVRTDAIQWKRIVQ